MEDVVTYAKVAAYLGAAFAVGIGTMGPALAQGLVGAKACENVAKYPQNGKIFGVMISALASIETSTLAATLIAVLLIFYAR